jgi:hypothetical protein
MQNTRRLRRSVRIDVGVLERKTQRYLTVQPWYEYNRGPGGWGALSRLALDVDLVQQAPVVWDFVFSRLMDLQETAPAASVRVSVDGLDVVRALATVAALELGLISAVPQATEIKNCT